MPLYEYECRQCGRRTEKIQKFSDPELTVCPHCGGTLERTITAPAVQFAGGGWYKDLYSSAKPAASGGSSTSAEGGSGSSSEAAAPSTTASEPVKSAAAPAPAAASKP